MMACTWATRHRTRIFNVLLPTCKMDIMAIGMRIVGTRGAFVTAKTTHGSLAAAMCLHIVMGRLHNANVATAEP